MEITRVFHPIGQGAFYSEHFISDTGEPLNIVFDCGSENITIGRKEVSQSFTKDDEIDILFISHFHEDHINFLKDLKNSCHSVKRVIIPLLDPTSTNIMKAWHSTGDTLYIDFLDNPESYLKNLFGTEVQIFKISDLEKSTLEENSWEKEAHLLEEQNNIILHSGMHITIHGLQNVWRFIPWNINALKYPNLITELHNSGLIISNLNDFSYVLSKITTIKNAYINTFGNKNLNDSSMTLFSIPDLGTQGYPTRAGCLYTGDLNAKKLFNGKIKNFLDFCIKKRLIHSVQIPHHGSLINHTPTLLRYPLSYPISFGYGNTYGHPSIKVISDIILRGGRLKLITEDPSSRFKKLFLRW